MVEQVLSCYWTTPDAKRDRQRHVSAPVTVFLARMVLAELEDIMPVGKWSMPRHADVSPGLEDFDGLKVCKAFASCTELHEEAIDLLTLLLGRITKKRRSHPVFHELM